MTVKTDWRKGLTIHDSQVTRKPYSQQRGYPNSISTFCLAQLR